MWGHARGGWQPASPAWLGLLSAAGVPCRALATEDADDGAGLLIVGEPDEWPEALDRAARAGRTTLTGPPPPDPGDALAAVRNGLGALVRPDLRGTLVLRLDDPGAAVKRHLTSWRHPDVAPEAWAALWNELTNLGR